MHSQENIKLILNVLKKLAFYHLNIYVRYVVFPLSTFT